MKLEVLTGENRCKWVCMGADGCDGTQGAWGTQKQGRQTTFRVLQVRIWVLWPGNFPRTSCFGDMCEKCYAWVQIGVDWFGWL